MIRLIHWLAWSVVVLIVLFAGLNWTVLTAETVLNLAVIQVQAPLGMVLLGLTALFVALFVVATLYTRIGYLLETRSLHHELRTVQNKADRAEASRLEELQKLMVAEFRSISERITRLEAKLPDHASSPAGLS